MFLYAVVRLDLVTKHTFPIIGVTQTPKQVQLLDFGLWFLTSSGVLDQN